MVTLLHKAPQLLRTNIDGLVEFVIIEFDFTLRILLRMSNVNSHKKYKKYIGIKRNEEFQNCILYKGGMLVKLTMVT